MVVVERGSNAATTSQCTAARGRQQTLEAAIVRDNVNGTYPSDHFPVSATVSFV